MEREEREGDSPDEGARGSGENESAPILSGSSVFLERPHLRSEGYILLLEWLRSFLVQPSDPKNELTRNGSALPSIQTLPKGAFGSMDEKG
jgi:hypothetical protein